MIVRRNRFGQLETEEIVASGALPIPGFSLSKLFLISVASGIAVYLITKWLDGRRS